MNTRYLFPNRYKKVGWLLLSLALIGYVIMIVFNLNNLKLLDIKVFALIDQGFPNSTSYFSIIKNNITDEIIAVFAIVGGILASFSKEKNEDEFISKIRLESLLWATYFNYALLLLAILLIYDISFLWVMIYNMFTLLVIFLIRFNFILYKNSKL